LCLAGRRAQTAAARLASRAACYKRPVTLRAILFDLDGTLVDSERETGEALARAMQEGQGIAIDQADRDGIIGRSWLAIYPDLRARYPAMTWTREEVISATARHREHVFAEQGLTILPGVRALLAWTRDLPRALVTGSARSEVTQVLPMIGPEATFDVVVAAEDVARSKPAPDGYQKAIAALGVAPGECLVIEDSRAGIAAGLAAGCVVLAVRAGCYGGWDQSAAHRVIDTLEELTPALFSELGALGALGAGPGAAS
jgi:HAD superfamily hydrolase (TIGR01509 family)